MKKVEEKRQRGRPPRGDEPMMYPVQVRLPREMRDRLDAIITHRLDRPDLSTVIRELLAKALEDRS